jgi:hypothetical protein
MEGEMKIQGLMLIAAVLLAGCARPQAAKLVEVEMAPLEVGTRTPDYEVVAPNALQLAPGVTTEPVKDANGNQGFVVMRQNNNGGFISCGCIGATTSSCVTVNDNPEHPECSGSCTDSEGNAHACGMTTEIGPPKDPFTLKYVSRARRTAAPDKN